MGKRWLKLLIISKKLISENSSSEIKYDYSTFNYRRTFPNLTHLPHSSPNVDFFSYHIAPHLTTSKLTSHSPSHSFTNFRKRFGILNEIFIISWWAVFYFKFTINFPKKEKMMKICNIRYVHLHAAKVFLFRGKCNFLQGHKEMHTSWQLFYRHSVSYSWIRTFRRLWQKHE